MEKYDEAKLRELILEQNKPYSLIGKMYGVSGAAIKKAAIKMGIPLPRRRTVNSKENFSHTGFKKNSLVNRISDEEFKSIVESSDSWKTIGEKLGYKNGLSSNVKGSVEARCSKLGVELNIAVESLLWDKTKGELFEHRKNWQSARSCIQKLARKTFFENNKTPKCAICGYSNHVEVAHIKAVSEFEDTATVREINSMDNLIGLCPNHHWEYDNGILTKNNLEVAGSIPAPATRRNLS